MKSPLNLVKERFGDKATLVSAIEKLATDDLWLNRVSEDKGLDRVSNAKLLHLHEVLSQTSERFGSREKLIDAILTLENRSKDDGYRARLQRYPLPRLLDAHRRADKVSKRPAPVAKSAKKPARSRKAQAKAAAARVS